MKHYLGTLASAVALGLSGANAAAQQAQTVTLSAAFVGVQQDYPWPADAADRGVEASGGFPLATYRIAEAGACEGRPVRVLYDVDMMPLAAAALRAAPGEDGYSVKLSPERLLDPPETIYPASGGEVEALLITSGGRPVRRVAVEDPESIGKLGEFADRVTASIDWPLDPDGPFAEFGQEYQIYFRTTIGSEDACGYTAQEAVTIRQVYGEHIREWQGAVCSEASPEPVAGKRLVAVLTIFAGGRAIGGTRAACPPD